MLGKKFVETQRERLSDPIERLNTAVATLTGALIGLVIVVSILIAMVATNAH